MFSMLAQFFRMFERLFAAGEKTAGAIDNLATVGLEMSQAYVDQSRYERQIQNVQLRKDLQAAKAA